MAETSTPPRMPTLVVRAANAFVDAATTEISDRIAQSIRARGQCRLAFAGGGTPRPIYEALAQRKDIDWSHVRFFWGDERAVGPADPDSNYRMVREALLERIEAPAQHVFRIEGEREPSEACVAYEAALGHAPLDLVLLGMGGDGHTASLFPGDAASEDTDARVVVTHSPLPPTTRISLSLRAINEAACVLLLVAGQSKAARVAEVWQQKADRTPELPTARVQPGSGALVWLLDDGAARRLPSAVVPNDEEIQ